MGVTLSIAHLEDREWSAWKNFEEKKFVEIHHRCRILRKINWETLWSNFLESSSTSFAIAPPELTALLEASVHGDVDVAPADIRIEINDYLEFVKERNSLGNEDTSHSKYMDFISVFTSVLLISEDHLEEKIDKLFELTDFNDDGRISLEELYLTITSVDRGLSYILGDSPSSAKYIYAASKKFFSLSELGRESETCDPHSQLGKKKFFEFCTNRQHTVRRLMELFGNAHIKKDTNGELQEVVTAEKLSCPSLDEPTGGDEWMSNPTWKKTAEIMTPQSHTGNPARPVSTLKLDWVHGYRGFDCRNNVRYVDAAASEFAFTAAALGVVQSVNRNGAARTQRYFGDHTDDIIALSVFAPIAGQDAAVTIATGEMGKKPVVYLWKPDANTGMVSLACMSGFHTKAVCQIAHSADGFQLFSVGIEYTVAVYNIQQDHKKFGKQICSAQGPKGKIFHATAYGSAGKSTKFLTCGEKHIVFWEIKASNSSISQTPAKLSREYSTKSFLSAARVGKSENVVVGAHTGELLLFTDPKKAPVPLPPGPKAVNALWSSNGDGECYLLAGCKEGVVYKYTFNADGSAVASVQSFKLPPFNNIPAVDSKSKKSPPNPIRSVSASADNKKVLIGTQKCEIVEVDAETAFGRPGSSPATLVEPTALPLVAGHYKDELWGLAIRPSIPGKVAEYASVGDDGHLRIFNLETREQTHVLDMGTMSRCCAYSPDGSMLAVGYGGRVGRGKQKMDGMFRIYRVDTSRPAQDSEWCTMIHEGRDAKQWISDIKFSEDGRVLAVGAKDNCIYVYLVAQKFKLKFKFSRHNSYITHFDISKDGQYMQSNCGAYELLFCSIKDGKPILKGSSLSNVKWSTWTCTLGWPVQGIWPPSADGSDINAVDRSPSGKLIATADDFGKVKVFRYPSVALDSQFCEYSGHSSHVTNVRWVADENGNDDYVITAGGNDKCLFQWKNIDGEESESAKKSSSKSSAVSDDEVFQLDEPSGGDEFMAIKPWKGAIKEPSNFGVHDKTRVVQFFAALGDLSNMHSELHTKFAAVPAKYALDVTPYCAEDADIAAYEQVSRHCSQVFERLTDSGYSSKDMPDNDEMELAWVHGYRAFDCRNNLRYADPTQQYIVYFAANVGIVLNKKTREQKYFRGHTDDILAMSTINTHVADVSGEVQIVASGQRGKKSTFVWTVPDMTLKSTLETGQKSICMLEFSKDARLLISIAEDNTVAVSDWANQRVVAKVDGEPAPTFHLARYNGEGANAPLFLTCGDKFMRLWSLSGRNLTSTKISTAHKKASPQKFLSAVYFSNQWVIGCMDGCLYVIPDGEKKVCNVLLPPPPVESATPAKGGGKTASSGKKTPAKGKSAAKGVKGVKLPPITSMFCVDGLLVTGDRVGQVMLWNKDLQFLQGISIDVMVNDVCNDMYRLVGPYRQIQSLCCVGTTEKCSVLVGTRGCDIVEVQCEGGQATVCAGSPLIQGHADDELWGLAVHPTRPIYCTVGDDKTLRVWNCHSRRMLKCVSLGNMARACDFNPTGDLIAVGFGGRVGRSSKVSQKNDGMVRIYSSKDLVSLVEIRDAKQWISDVKFSPDGQALAVGSHNNTVYIYDIEQSTAKGAERGALILKIRCKFSKHNSYITHMDFSVDSRFLQSNCGAYELLFCDTSNGKQITSATELRDVKWSTWTGCLGWPVQGIWPAGADGTDINAVSRSHSGHLVATSDDFGMVRVLKYPCIEEGADALNCAGHSSHVMNVRWTVADEYLISVGGNDKTVLQWKHTISSMDGTSSDKISGNSEPEVVETSSFELEEPTGGDEFMAVKPWRGAIRAPEHPPVINSSVPSTELALQWVHGYTSGSAGSDNSRISSNLHYNIDNNIVYPAAALGVCLNHDISNSANSTQTYFTGHDDDVLCLAISFDRRFIATGQTASKSSKGTGKICIWDAKDCRLLSEMKGAHKRGVVSVAFSPSNDKLLSIGLDNNYTHTLWSDVGGSWSRVQQSATTKSDQKTHLYSLWVADPDKFDCHFVSGGATSVHFWKIEGSAMTKKESRFGKFPQKPILCAAGLNMKDGKYSLVTGTSSGGLYIFEKDRECKNVVENAHSGAIITLVGSKEGDFIISGGSDKCIKIWNHALQAITNCQLGQDLAKSPVNATVASLDYRIDATNNLVVLVGTYGGEIMEISANISDDDESSSKIDRSEERDMAVPLNFDLVAENALCLLHSHYSGELWAVATHPVNADLVATGGDDSTIRIWSIKQQRMLCCLAVGKDVRAVCWDPSGTILCVGFNGSGGKKSKGKSKGKGKGKGKGKKASNEGEKKNEPGAIPDMDEKACAVFAFSPETFQLQFLGAGCPSGDYWVSDVKISPGGNYLGVGSHSKQLYMYNVPKEPDGSISQTPARWEKAFSEKKGTGKFKPFNKHSSAITHFDFSSDEKYFQSNCQAYELLFGVMETGKQQTKATELAVYNQDIHYDGGDDDDVIEKSWASWTCTLGWPVQGIWQESAGGSDINSVDRSHSQTLVATADDFGEVKLFRYPCVDEASQYKSFAGHSSHVTNVRWTLDDNTLVSVGGNDKCLFIWKVEK